MATFTAAAIFGGAALAATGWPDGVDDRSFSIADPSARSDPPESSGDDFISNRAEPEHNDRRPVVRVGGVPVKTFSLVTHGADTLETAVAALNPTGDPSIVICEEEGGSFTGLHARGPIPAFKRPPDGVSCDALFSD
jgi:hypothetical protein